jgi:hypothetical protein
MGERIDRWKKYVADNEVNKKVKSHFETHKELYLRVAGGVAIAGITAIVMRDRHANLLKGLDGPTGATVRSLNFFSKGGDIVTTVHNGGRGHPGFRVHNFEHNLDFDTQGIAARTFSIPENVMSMHLNKKIPDAYGLHFDRIIS